MLNSPLYAFDFDGVICDSAIETSITGWKVAQSYWPEMQQTRIDDALISAFRQVRPYLETGYEAILIMRLLYNKISVADLCADYEQHITTLLTTEKLETTTLKKAFGTMRDQWIEQDEQDWLDKNPLFLGITEKLRTLAANQWYIITTKQERFVQRILAGSQIELAAERIYGMDRGMSKQQVLEELSKKHIGQSIVFVEDRLPTLNNLLDNPALKQLRLQLVDWGYNTLHDRKSIIGTRIQLVTQNEFLSLGK
jgi:phosphoglycolate phosphatase-like HAD superfamily hydrolase